MQPFQTNWDLNLGFGFGLVVRSSIIGLATGGLSNRVGDRLELERYTLLALFYGYNPQCEGFQNRSFQMAISNSAYLIVSTFFIVYLILAL